jgi:hypothetical protein
MSKHNKKSTKPHTNWLELIIQGLVDLVVGFVLLIIAKLLE